MSFFLILETSPPKSNSNAALAEDIAKNHGFSMTSREAVQIDVPYKFYRNAPSYEDGLIWLSRFGQQVKQEGLQVWKYSISLCSSSSDDPLRLL